MPTKYRQEYCEELVRACQEGFSLTGWAGKKGLGVQTVRDWLVRFPEFAEAMARAKAARIEWFEARMRNILMEGGTGGQATLLMFLLKNAGPDEYRERQELTGADGKPLIEDADPSRIAASLLELLKSEQGWRPHKTKDPENDK